MIDIHTWCKLKDIDYMPLFNDRNFDIYINDIPNLNNASYLFSNNLIPVDNIITNSQVLKDILKIKQKMESI